MLEQSSTGRTYTRDAYAPVRRDAHAEAEKLTAGSIPARFHFYNFEESVLDRSGARLSPFASALPFPPVIYQSRKFQTHRKQKKVSERCAPDLHDAISRGIAGIQQISAAHRDNFHRILHTGFVTQNILDRLSPPAREALVNLVVTLFVGETEDYEDISRIVQAVFDFRLAHFVLNKCDILCAQLSNSRFETDRKQTAESMCPLHRAGEFLLFGTGEVWY